MFTDTLLGQQHMTLAYCLALLITSSNKAAVSPM